jgi:hypothetical protein
VDTQALTNERIVEPEDNSYDDYDNGGGYDDFYPDAPLDNVCMK